MKFSILFCCLFFSACGDPTPVQIEPIEVKVTVEGVAPVVIQTETAKITKPMATK